MFLGLSFSCYIQLGIDAGSLLNEACNKTDSVGSGHNLLTNVKESTVRT